MQDLQYIDDYFKGVLPQAETGRFEQRILTEPPFAEAVSFYCMAVQAARQELAPHKKKRFRELYQQYNITAKRPQPSLVRRLMPYAAAAAVIAALVLGWWLWMRPVPPQQMASAYLQQEQLTRFSVTMGGPTDSLQTAIGWYNNGKKEAALQQLESMLARDAANATVRKYAGIVSLQLGAYDKALGHFRLLEQYPHLYSNPGKFYYALTLMKRSLPGDLPKAKELLQQVVQDNLEGKNDAQQWLSKW